MLASLDFLTWGIMGNIIVFALILGLAAVLLRDIVSKLARLFSNFWM